MKETKQPRLTVSELTAVLYAISEKLAGELDGDEWTTEISLALETAEGKLTAELARREAAKAPPFPPNREVWEGELHKPKT